MNRSRTALTAATLSLAAWFSLPGCTVYVVNSQATPVPYPTAWRIELRVRGQINRISSSLQQGLLDQQTADYLAENDALVRRLLRGYQGTGDAMVDVNPQQAAWLNGMLNDNDSYIDDAIQRHQAWVSYFQGGNYDYQASDHVIFVASLDYRLRQQQAAVNSGLASGTITTSQAQDLQGRIQSIRGLEQNCFRTNGRLDLSEEQVGWLNRMVEDNNRYVRFRLRGNRGHWNQDRFASWRRQTPVGLGAGGNAQWGRRQNNYGNQSSSAANSYSAPPVPTLTPVPVARPGVKAPTFTPVPVVRPGVNAYNPTPVPQVVRANAGGNLTRLQTPPTATFTQQPVVVPWKPTFTAIIPVPTATPIRVIQSLPPAAVPTATPTKVVVKERPKPTFTPAPKRVPPGQNKDKKPKKEGEDKGDKSKGSSGDSDKDQLKKDKGDKGKKQDPGDSNSQGSDSKEGRKPGNNQKGDGQGD